MGPHTHAYVRVCVCVCKILLYTSKDPEEPIVLVLSFTNSSILFPWSHCSNANCSRPQHETCKQLLTACVPPLLPPLRIVWVHTFSVPRGFTCPSRTWQSPSWTDGSCNYSRVRRNYVRAKSLPLWAILHSVWCGLQTLSEDLSLWSFHHWFGFRWTVFFPVPPFRPVFSTGVSSLLRRLSTSRPKHRLTRDIRVADPTETSKHFSTSYSGPRNHRVPTLGSQNPPSPPSQWTSVLKLRLDL